MKTAIKLTLAVVLMMSATSLFAQKFGRINTSEIIASMPEMKQMQVDMENFGKTLNEGIEPSMSSTRTNCRSIRRATTRCPRQRVK